MDTDKESEANQKNIAKDGKKMDSNDKRNASEDFENKSNSDFLSQYCDKNAIKGKAVFVVNKFEKSKGLERKGAEKDRDYLKHIFIDKLGFEQLNENQEFNLSKRELIDVLTKTSEMVSIDTEIFVFAISTHGEERPKHTEEYEHALMCDDEEYVFTSDIIDKFTRNSFLDGKPKLFFIQACRIPYGTDIEEDANFYDPGHKILIKDANEEKNEPENSGPKQVDTLTKMVDNCSLLETDVHAAEDAGNGRENGGESNFCPGSQGQSPVHFLSISRCPKDCLVFYAAQSGKGAWHGKTSGSVMIQQLYKTIRNYKDTSSLDLFDFLTKTAYGMAEGKYPKDSKSVPVIQHRLTKGLHIPLIKHKE